jgi:ABC-type transporter Mla MlaB component
MRLEGKVVGPWVEECHRAWQAVREELGAKTLRLDLCGVTFVDESGTAMLREIHRASGGEILANSPLTNYFKERIIRAVEEIDEEGV